MWKIREQIDKVTNVVMMFTDAEIKVREATNDEQWGPHGTLMGEIAKLTYRQQCYQEVMGMLWKRMFHEAKHWRRLAKCLQLLYYLILNGSERVINTTREHLYDLRELEDYHEKDENGKDQGINVRVKSRDIIELIKNDERLRDERKRAKGTQGKYVGVASYSADSGITRNNYNNNSSSFGSEYLGRFKDTLKQIGVERDYSEYNIETGRRHNAYRDEPVEPAAESNYETARGEYGYSDGTEFDRSQYQKYEDVAVADDDDDDDDDDDFKNIRGGETLKEKVEKEAAKRKAETKPAPAETKPPPADDFGDFQALAPVVKVEAPKSPPINNVQSTNGVSNQPFTNGLSTGFPNVAQNLGLNNGSSAVPVKKDTPISPFDEFDPLVFGSAQTNTPINSQSDPNDLLGMADIMQPVKSPQQPQPRPQIAPNMNQLNQFQSSQSTNKTNWMNATNPRLAYNNQPMTFQPMNNSMARPSFNNNNNNNNNNYNNIGNTNFANFQNAAPTSPANVMTVNNQMLNMNLVNWPS